MNDIIDCVNCKTKVLPNSELLCPACGKTAVEKVDVVNKDADNGKQMMAVDNSKTKKIKSTTEALHQIHYQSPVKKSQLIYCPDCKKAVSDAAVTCPNCGHPISKTIADDIISIRRVTARSDGFAGCLGLLLGPVGLWYKGQWVAGFAWLAVTIILGIVAFPLAVLCWFGMAFHAAVCAQIHN